jgi:hypothetical protein
MSEILSISQLGKPILRQRAQEINDLRQPHMQRLIDAETWRVFEHFVLGVYDFVAGILSENRLITAF